MGTVSRRLGVGKGMLLNAAHRLAEILRPASEGLRGLLWDAAANWTNAGHRLGFHVRFDATGEVIKGAFRFVIG